MKSRLHIIVASVMAVLVLASVIGMEASAQRRVTPLKSSTKDLRGKNENRSSADTISRPNMVEMTDDAGNKVWVDTIAGVEVSAADSTNLFPAGSIPKMKCPLMYRIAFGADLWDPVMRLFGQKYGITEFSAELNLHNRYIPVAEVGIGMADYTPAGNNYTYHVPVTPYFRLGMNYNFIYNSNPDYMAYVGLRFGWTGFNYYVNDVTLSSGYWCEDVSFNLPRQRGSFTYMQVLFGIRVKIAGPVSMGWSMRYNLKLHEKKGVYGNPWYIPGYGTRDGGLTGSFSIFYTLPLSRETKE